MYTAMVARAGVQQWAAAATAASTRLVPTLRTLAAAAGGGTERPEGGEEGQRNPFPTENLLEVTDGLLRSVR